MEDLQAYFEREKEGESTRAAKAGSLRMRVGGAEEEEEELRVANMAGRPTAEDWAERGWNYLCTEPKNSQALYLHSPRTNKDNESESAVNHNF